MIRAALSLIALPFLIAVVTHTHPTSLGAGTRIACIVETPVDSATNQAGDNFTLAVADPSYPWLHGAKIAGHFTRVQGPHGLNRARIDFLFDSITFENGEKEPIRAYVISPNVVNKTGNAPRAAVTPPSAPFAASSSTIVWQTSIGSAPKQTSQTGGYAYAGKNGAQIVVAVGTHVTLELASTLKTP
jgi:hypothetical protein